MTTIITWKEGASSCNVYTSGLFFREICKYGQSDLPLTLLPDFGTPPSFPYLLTSLGKVWVEKETEECHHQTHTHTAGHIFKGRESSKGKTDTSSDFISSIPCQDPHGVLCTRGVDEIDSRPRLQMQCLGLLSVFSETYFPGDSDLTGAPSEIYCQALELAKIRRKYSTHFKQFYKSKKKINADAIKMLI